MKLFKAFLYDERGLYSMHGREKYEIGKTYTLSSHSPLVLCHYGYHGCPIPLDCFRFYPKTSKLMEIEVHEEHGILKGYSIKACFRSFTIVKEVDLDRLCGRFEDFWGTVKYITNGKLDRKDGPAISTPKCESWYQEGKLHRIDGPAIVFPDGRQEWYQDGVLHRVGGPAVLREDRQEWYKNGKLHREDGPAIIRDSGVEEWFLDGVRHRIGGPAVDRFRYVDRVPINKKGKRAYVLGSNQWIVNGKWHREDGPAIEYVSGIKEWRQNDLLHREDGPALEHSNGCKKWFYEGLLHREDGPAVEYKNGVKEWWVRGNMTRKVWK